MKEVFVEPVNLKFNDKISSEHVNLYLDCYMNGLSLNGVINTHMWYLKSHKLEKTQYESVFKCYKCGLTLYGTIVFFNDCYYDFLKMKICEVQKVLNTTMMIGTGEDYQVNIGFLQRGPLFLRRTCKQQQMIKALE